MNTAIKTSKSLSILALCLAPLYAAAADNPAQVEVPVTRVMFPAKGYDDNDNVQIVIEGDLPDPCYVLGKQQISQDPSGVITVHQYAWRRQGDACDTGDLLGESPFSEEVSLGRLKPGDYRVAFVPDEDKVQYKPLRVDVATMSATDDFNYARVTTLKVPDVVLEGQHAQIAISGPFSSSCNKLKEPIGVERVGESLVIRPIEINLGDCGWVLRTFDKAIDLGVLPPGEYLVHVRSKNGKAVEKTFKVIRTH